MKPSKVIVTNGTSLSKKYGHGTVLIRAALKKLAAADAKRGISSIVIDLADSGQMSKIGGTRVVKASDPAQNKRAIDTVHAFYEPDYLLILGSTDVVPHQDLKNPLYEKDDDDDRFAYSDLPYACKGKYSNDTRDFRNPTRVVGRLPDITNGTDPKYLVGLINTAASCKSRPASVYSEFFGLTAEVWNVSTKLSLSAAFGKSSGIHSVPPKTYTWTTAHLKPASHFINCHGSLSSPEYVGESESVDDYPRAHFAPHIKGKTAPGTVVAAECCYGAELYDPSDAGEIIGIPNQYLKDGAYGFWGSTTIAYGPADSNDQADLLCQYFFIELLRGASLGRAVLQARQRYISQAGTLSPTDLKTLAQFILLGDPSVHPVLSSSKSGSVSMTVKKGHKLTMSTPKQLAANQRSFRRRHLERRGLALPASTGVVGRASTSGTKSSMNTILKSELRKMGVARPRASSYRVLEPGIGSRSKGGKGSKAKKTLSSALSPKAIYVALGKRKVKDSTRIEIVGMEIAEYDGEVVMKKFYSR